MSRRDRDEILKKLPQVLDIQKKKLLIAMGQPPDGVAEKLSAEQEMLVKEVAKTLGSEIGVFLPNISKGYSNITNSVSGTLKRYAIFQLETYLKCANIICIIFKQKHTNCGFVYKIMEYLLRHARQFSDPSKTIFEADTQGATYKLEQINVDIPDKEQGSCEFAIVDRATALIEELHQAYDEDKFRALNALVTSFTLVIARRFIKRKHLKQNPIFCLIVHAYLTTDDEKTKKNLYDTCIKHMEWYDMHMPSLFFKVLDLYNIGAGELWDALMSTEQMKHVEQRIIMSLIVFAETYYDMYKVHSPQQQQWFPFLCILCDMDSSNGIRYFDENGVSDEANTRVCMVLHSLVEMINKNVYKVHNHYTKPMYSDWARETAAEIMLKITK